MLSFLEIYSQGTIQVDKARKRLLSIKPLHVTNGLILMSILPSQFESKIGLKEPENRGTLSYMKRSIIA